MPNIFRLSRPFVSVLTASVFAWLSQSAMAQNAQQANVIENTVALQVSQTKCGYKVNNEMLSTVFSAANMQPRDLVRGGKYYGEVAKNQARVSQLVATDAGKSSFCRNVKNELSAMFD